MRLLLIGFSLLMSLPLLGQDIIVRITGDTLHVRIESANETFVYYTAAETKRGTVDVISRKEVKEILYRFENPSDQLRKKAAREERDYEFVQFSLAYSLNYLPNASIPEDDFKEYYEELQFGKGFNAGVNFFFNKHLGIGMIYSKSRFKNSIPVILNNSVTGNLSDDMKLHYGGLGVAARFAFGNSASHLTLSAGAGMNFYNNDAAIVYGYNLKAQGIGIHLDANMNLSLGGGLYIAIRASYIGNTVNDFALETQNGTPADIVEVLEYSAQNSDGFSVSRIAISAGLMLGF